MELSNEEKGSPEHESYWKSPCTRVIRLFIAFTLFMYISKSGKIPLMQSRAEHVIAKSAWKADNP